MNAFKLMPLLKKYKKCPQCGNNLIGKHQGSIRVEEVVFTRTCKCGFKISVDANDIEVVSND